MIIQQTIDGSPTLFSPQFNATYHSKHGAVQETRHIFIEAALLEKAKTIKELHILEIGFGTGLNALMTLLTALQKDLTIHYTTIEAYPVPMETVTDLNHILHTQKEHQEDLFLKIHTANWNEPTEILPNFTLHKIHDFFENINFKNQFEVIYYDAFAPETQPHLWELPILTKMYDALKNEGLLSTYCAKGSVKRALKSAGFSIEALAGPVGKREMTRAWKKLK